MSLREFESWRRVPLFRSLIFLFQEVSDAFDHGSMFSAGFMGVGEREMHVEVLNGSFDDLCMYT